MTSLVERDALVGNLLDRLDALERRIRYLEDTHPGLGGEAAGKLAYYRADGSLHIPGLVYSEENAVWGFYDRWAEYVYAQAAGGGNAVASMTAVPTGYVYVLQALAFNHDAAAAKLCDVDLVLGAVAVRLITEATWAAGTVRTWQGEIALKPADYVRLTVTAPGDTKWGYMWLCGYMLRVT